MLANPATLARISIQYRSGSWANRPENGESTQMVDKTYQNTSKGKENSNNSSTSEANLCEKEHSS